MLEYMTELQEREYLHALIRVKRIEQGIDPDTGKRRGDWSQAEDSAFDQFNQREYVRRAI